MRDTARRLAAIGLLGNELDTDYQACADGSCPWHVIAHPYLKAAPFKRNDAMLDVLPMGGIVFPDTGIQDNLADRVKRLGVPVFDFRGK